MHTYSITEAFLQIELQSIHESNFISTQVDMLNFR